MTLLRNAVQAIAGKGTVVIRTSTDQTSVCIQISDSGKGIPPEQLMNIFDFSFTTKDERVGMGMGLINAYHTIQKHSGEIKVESEMEKGSTFSVTLPLKLEQVRKHR
jgi:signal transduction histidine kinase